MRYLILATALLLGAAAAEPVTLVRDGQAQLPVIVAEDAGESVREAAEELATYLRRISGATVAVESGDGSRGIVLGSAADFPALELPPAIRSPDTTYHHVERYLLRSGPERLLLIGATEAGVPHAVYDLLRELGCRWFFPSDAWEHIPSKPTLTLAIDRLEEPAFLGRRIWYGYGFFDRTLTRPSDEYHAWNRRNRMGHSLTTYTGHAWQSIIDRHQATFDANPEYLALVNGKRQGEQLCVSNAELRKLVVADALAFFERFPDRDMVSLDPSDGTGHCECEPCAELGSVSDRVFGLANEAAKALQEARPGKLVGSLAYNYHSEPPAFQLEPNVYIELTRGFIRGDYSFDELMELWPQHARAMGYYDYYSVYLWDWDMPPGGRGANVDYLTTSIRDYARRNAWTLSAESGNNWGLHGRGYYLAAQLLWDPTQDAEAILQEFYRTAFGPAAEPVRRWYERLDPANSPLPGEHLWALALRDLQAATEMAQAHPAVLARLDHLKQYMHYVRLRWDFNHSQDAAEKKRLALAILTHVYRNRYSYMNHWEALRQHATRTWARDFEEPTWAFNEPTRPKPWQLDTPNPPELTAEQFADDLERFQPRDFTTRDFFTELVPAGFTEGPAADLYHRFQRGTRYALWSRAGEPLTVTLTFGTIAHYRDRRDASWTLLDADGEEIATQRCDLDGEPKTFTMEVPAAGPYRLQIDDSGAGFNIRVPAEQPAVLPLERGRRYLHAGHMQRIWFYVPKGTERISYFLTNSTPHDVHGPDGELLQTMDVSGDIVNLPVPEGMDGQVWSMKRLAPGQLWFFNVPPVIAGSPGGLMLPRELLPELPANTP